LEFLRLGVSPTWSFSDLEFLRLGVSPTWSWSFSTWSFSDLEFLRLGVSPTWSFSHLEFLRLGVSLTWSFSNLEFLSLGVSLTWSFSDLEFLRLEVSRTCAGKIRCRSLPACGLSPYISCGNMRRTYCRSSPWRLRDNLPATDPQRADRPLPPSQPNQPKSSAPELRLHPHINK